METRASESPRKSQKELATEGEIAEFLSRSF